MAAIIPARAEVNPARIGVVVWIARVPVLAPLTHATHPEPSFVGTMEMPIDPHGNAEHCNEAGALSADIRRHYAAFSTIKIEGQTRRKN